MGRMTKIYHRKDKTDFPVIFSSFGILWMSLLFLFTSSVSAANNFSDSSLNSHLSTGFLSSLSFISENNHSKFQTSFLRQREKRPRELGVLRHLSQTAERVLPHPDDKTRGHGFSSGYAFSGLHKFELIFGWRIVATRNLELHQFHRLQILIHSVLVRAGPIAGSFFA